MNFCVYPLADHIPEALLLATDLQDNVRQTSEEAVSVIHAPESFASWVSLGLSYCQFDGHISLIHSRSRETMFLHRAMPVKAPNLRPRRIKPVSTP